MPYANAALNAAVDAIKAAGTWIALHSADPGGSGTTGELSGGGYARQQTTWGAAAAGVVVGSQVTTPVGAGTTVSHWSLWSASSGGTFLYGGAVDASETWTGAGNASHTPTIRVINP